MNRIPIGYEWVEHVLELMWIQRQLVPQFFQLAGDRCSARFRIPIGYEQNTTSMDDRVSVAWQGPFLFGNNSSCVAVDWQGFRLFLRNTTSRVAVTWQGLFFIRNTTSSVSATWQGPFFL